MIAYGGENMFVMTKPTGSLLALDRGEGAHLKFRPASSVPQ